MADAWKPYVDNIIASKHFRFAALIGSQTVNNEVVRSVWAQSDGFNLTPEEGIEIAQAATQPDKTTFVLGQRPDPENPAEDDGSTEDKYFVVRRNPDVGGIGIVFGKFKQAGAILATTRTVVLIGIYKTGVQPGDASMSLTRIADYLYNNNY
eukprot:TRINITY_DN57979_c0_g1_i1.p1 TRINITY_DN57979_c0_g1~~TRINITY_DN57979_c0_g1_i1.p1  ORF type:complete len:152 (+),score=1.32 TRINITY_DN57979_c0_g1_i1:83-538(+)